MLKAFPDETTFLPETFHSTFGFDLEECIDPEDACENMFMPMLCIGNMRVFSPPSHFRSKHLTFDTVNATGVPIKRWYFKSIESIKLQGTDQCRSWVVKTLINGMTGFRLCITEADDNFSPQYYGNICFKLSKLTSRCFGL